MTHSHELRAVQSPGICVYCTRKRHLLLREIFLEVSGPQAHKHIDIRFKYFRIQVIFVVKIAKLYDFQFGPGKKSFYETRNSSLVIIALLRYWLQSG